MAKNNSKQAYKQAPWRRQLRSVGMSLVPVIALVVVISIYLIISAESASAGLEIMDMHYEEEEILRVIANHRTELAWKTSYSEMTRRAEKIGYGPAPSESIHFMTIPGHQGQNTVVLASLPESKNTPGPLLNEYYQESLWEWIYGTFLTTPQYTIEACQ
jgi:hypothetical protein